MIIRILAITILILLVSLLFPFWGWVMIVPFLFSLGVMKRHRSAFFNSAFAGLLAWGVMSVFRLFNGSDLVAQQMAEVIGVQSKWFLILLTAVLAALLAGVAGLTGFSLRKLVAKD